MLVKPEVQRTVFRVGDRFRNLYLSIVVIPDFTSSLDPHVMAVYAVRSISLSRYGLSANTEGPESWSSCTDDVPVFHWLMSETFSAEWKRCLIRARYRSWSSSSLPVFKNVETPSHGGRFSVNLVTSSKAATMTAEWLTAFNRLMILRGK